MSERYFVVCDPSGTFVHTTVSVRPETAIEEWLEQEVACNLVVNLGRGARGEPPICSPSWEQFEAEGYSVRPVRIYEDKTDKD